MSLTSGDAPTAPLPITDRIVIALDQLKIARAEGNPTQEFAWEGRMDRVIDAFINLLKGRNLFRPLSEIDPVLDARLTVKEGIKLIGRCAHLRP